MLFKQILFSIFLFTATSFSFAVEIIKLKASDHQLIISALPEESRETIIVVSVNGLNFGEFLSGGKITGYQISPASMYANEKITKIAKTMFDAGIRLDDAFIQVISGLEEHQYQQAVAAFTQALEHAYKAIASSSTASSSVVIPPPLEAALDQAQVSMALISKRYAKAKEDVAVVRKAISTKNELSYLEIFLEYCLHAESAFMDKFLIQSRHPSHLAPPQVIKIYGNRDPCFHCQITLSKFADLLFIHQGKQLVEICYYSQKIFEGPCKLPPAICNSSALANGPYIPGQTYATRFSKDDGELLAFIFKPTQPMVVSVFDVK